MTLHITLSRSQLDKKEEQIFYSVADFKDQEKNLL